MRDTCVAAARGLHEDIVALADRAAHVAIKAADAFAIKGEPIAYDEHFVRAAIYQAVIESRGVPTNIMAELELHTRERIRLLHEERFRVEQAGREETRPEA